MPDDQKKLIEAAAQADEVATALPSVAFFNYLGWVKAGFAQQPDREREKLKQKVKQRTG